MRDERLTTCLGMIVAILIMVTVSPIANGWALSTIWNWFMPPIFGIVSLTLWQAIGVSMVFGIFTGTNRISSKSEDNTNKTFGEVFVTQLILAILTPVLTVGIAWIVFQFAF